MSCPAYDYSNLAIYPDFLKHLSTMFYYFSVYRYFTDFPDSSLNISHFYAIDNDVFLICKTSDFYCYYIYIKLIIIDLLKSLSSDCLFFFFFVDSVRFSIQMIMSSVTRVSFTSSHPIWISFFPFLGVWKLSQLKQETEVIVRLNLFASYTSVTTILWGLVLSSLKIILMHM